MDPETEDKHEIEKMGAYWRRAISYKLPILKLIMKLKLKTVQKT